MDTPDYIICLECDTPVYTFDWDGIRIAEAEFAHPAATKSRCFSRLRKRTEEMMASEDGRHYGSGND